MSQRATRNPVSSNAPAQSDRSQARFEQLQQRWTAVLKRDKRADGDFVFGVRTTGIYCRPSCPARRPRRENVQFFSSAREARAAGLRACRRCSPDVERGSSPAAERIAQAHKRICAERTPPTVGALAEALGVSVRQLRRDFQEHLQMSVQEWIAGERGARLRQRLPDRRVAAEAIFAAGFRSGSAAYESAARELGMTPATFAHGGRGERIRFGVTSTRFGNMIVASTDRGLCHVALGDDARQLRETLCARFHAAVACVEDAEFARVVAAVTNLVDGREPRPVQLPLDLRGTAFQKRVWKMLQAIPRGQTVTYAELAARLQMPSAARAVARACASNGLAVLVPCHRVIRADGGLGGYRWGLERKRALLDAERDACVPRRR